MRLFKHGYGTQAAPKKIAERWINTHVEKFFHDSLMEIYWVEKYLTGILSRFQKAAVVRDLKDAIDEHIAQTRGHAKRLEEIFELSGKKPGSRQSEAIAALVTESDAIVGATEPRSLARDAGIIMSMRKVKHNEIGIYCGLVQLAKTMGLDEVLAILGQTLLEERETDEALNNIAESGINWSAKPELAKVVGR